VGLAEDGKEDVELIDMYLRTLEKMKWSLEGFDGREIAS